MLHFVDNAARHFFQHIVRNPCPVGGHEIGGRNAAQRDGVIVRPAVAHDADAADAGQYGKILIDLAIQPSQCDFLAENGVSVFQYIQLVGCNSPSTRIARPGAGKGWRQIKRIGDAQLRAAGTHFVFEQIAQRFNNAFESDVFRQTADVVMTFDHRRIASSAFDNVRINRPLAQKFHFAQFAGILLRTRG